MERNKLKIAQQFLANRSFEMTASRQLAAHPDIAKDQGLKQTLLDSSLTTYRAMMFALGTPISSIHDNVEKIKQTRTTRNGIVEFAQTIYSTWDLLSEANKPVELNVNEEVQLIQIS